MPIENPDPQDGSPESSSRPLLSRRQCVYALAGLPLLARLSVAADESAAANPQVVPPTSGQTSSEADSDATKRRYDGQVVSLTTVLERQGIRAGSEMDCHFVLETTAGTVFPILADWRGRAFYQDERLRNRKVTLIAHRRPDLGYLQPLMVFTYDDLDQPQFTDYWCDICSIPMYEIQPCECCQGDIRLRFTPQSPPMDVPDWNARPME